MQGIVGVMTQVFNGIKAEGAYFVLVLAALYILYRVNAKKYQWYIYFILLIQILVVANPLTVMVLSKAFPVLATYNTFMLLTPVLLVIPFAGAEVFERAKDDRQIKVWLLLAAVVIGLSGNLFGFYSNDSTAKTCSAEQTMILREVDKLQKEAGYILAVADEAILPYIRTEIPEVDTLYGRDLYQHGMDLGIVDMYSEELMSFYEAMKNPSETINDILSMADLYGCNVVIVKRFDGAPVKMGHFSQLLTSKHYIIYTIQE